MHPSIKTHSLGALLVLTLLTFACGPAGPIGESGAQGSQGDQGSQGAPGTMGNMGTPGTMGLPGTLDPTQTILNGTAVQTANFNISGNGLFGGKVGIGTTTPAAKLTAVAGTDTWAADFLGLSTSDKVRVGTLGGVATIGANNNAGTVWTNLSINPGPANVGIGTTTPTTKLTSVAGVDDWSGNFQGLATSDGVRLGTYLGVATVAAKNTAGDAWANLAINPGGNVGIGTSSPGNKLSVNGTSVFGGASGTSMETIELQGAASGIAHKDRDGVSTRWVNYALNGVMRFFNDANGDVVAITTAGNVGIGTNSPTTRLTSVAGIDTWSGDFLGLSTSDRLRIGTYQGHPAIGANNNAGTAWTNLLINPGATSSIGYVGIGTATPDALLTVNGTATKPGGGTWATQSDARLKDFRGAFTAGVDAVMRLAPVRYEYKTNNALGIHSPGEHIGFSAQEVEKVIPEAVTKDSRGYRMVNADPIMWAMLNAIKEQQGEIAQVRAQSTPINELETENAALRARVARLEQVVDSLVSERAIRSK